MVEILITVGILGILTAAVAFAAGGSTERSAATACSADSKSLTKAEDVFNAQYGRYATETELVDARIIRRESNLNDVIISGDEFTIVAVVNCGAAETAGGGTVSSSPTTAPPGPSSTAVTSPTTTTAATTTTIPTTTTTIPTTTTTIPTTTTTTTAASQLVITVQPTNTPAGTSINPAIVVTVRDAANKIVSGSTNTVTLTITGGSGSPAGKLTCAPSSKTAVAGTVTFGSCSISKSWTGYRLTASSPGLTSAVSTTFNVT